MVFTTISRSLYRRSSEIGHSAQSHTPGKCWNLDQLPSTFITWSVCLTLYSLCWGGREASYSLEGEWQRMGLNNYCRQIYPGICPAQLWNIQQISRWLFMYYLRQLFSAATVLKRHSTPFQTVRFCRYLKDPDIMLLFIKTL